MKVAGCKLRFLPIPIFILPSQPLLQFFLIARKGELVALADGLGVYLLHADATFDARHGSYQSAEPSVARCVRRRQQLFFSSQAS